MLIGVKSCRQLFVLIIGCMKNMGSPNYLRTSFNLLSMIYEVEYCFVVWSNVLCTCTGSIPVPYWCCMAQYGTTHHQHIGKGAKSAQHLYHVLLWYHIDPLYDTNYLLYGPVSWWSKALVQNSNTVYVLCTCITEFVLSIFCVVWGGQNCWYVDLSFFFICLRLHGCLAWKELLFFQRGLFRCHFHWIMLQNHWAFSS